MYAITLHQPWASLIALGVKTVEPDHGRRRNDCDDADRTSTLRWQLL